MKNNNNLPDNRGYFGAYGGQFIPEILRPAMDELEQAYLRQKDNKEFQDKLQTDLQEYGGRPTSLYFAENITEYYGRAKIYLKREDLNHTGAHKINNTIGQALLAQALGATRVVAETGAGQHGVAAAAACARVGLPCTVYMGEVDIARQAPNVDRIVRLGAKVVPVTSGDRTLRAAINEAMRDWVADPDDTD